MMDRGDQQAILKYLCLHIFIMLLCISVYSYRNSSATKCRTYNYFVSANFSGFVPCTNNLGAQIPRNEIKVWLKDNFFSYEVKAFVQCRV